MIVREFVPEDYEMMSIWYHKRKLDPIRRASIPEHGFVVPDVAVGFLYKTDSDLGIIEGFITNPTASPEDRNRAQEMIVDALLKCSTDLGFCEVYAFSSDASIQTRASKWGFNTIGECLMLSKEVL